MNKNQTGDIFYRLVSQTSCSIAKCLKCTSTWIYGVFQINRTSKISTCKQCMKIPAFSHLFEVDFSETFSLYLMTSAENSVSEPPNLKIVWRRIYPPHPPRYQKPTNRPAHDLIETSDCGNKMAIMEQGIFFLSIRFARNTDEDGDRVLERRQ